MANPSVLKQTYERLANQLVDRGMLGYGLHEDLLINSSAWFSQPIGDGGYRLSDYYTAALNHNIALIFALPRVDQDQDTIGDLFEFLHHLVVWIEKLPLGLLSKSPEPLVRPATVDVCDKNFTDTALRLVAPRDRIDLDPLDANLAALDADYCERHGLDPRERIPLRDVLAGDDDMP